MPARSIDIDGTHWTVQTSGYVSQYDADEFGVLFSRGSGGGRELRMSRYRPCTSRARGQSFAECSDADLRELFRRSQPSETSPEGGYVG